MIIHRLRPTRIAAPLAFASLFLTGAAVSAARTWTDRSGLTFDGDLARVEGPVAVLLVNGYEFHFPLANLSTVDRQAIVQLRRAQLPVAAAAATPVPTPVPVDENVLALAAAKSSADEAFNAYNAAFLVKAGGKTYYKKSTTNPEPYRFWVQATEIQLAEDVYDRTHSGAHRQLVSDLLTTFLAKEGPDWGYNSWNDDMAWMAIACVRGYQITRNPVFLQAAANNWKMTYDRGWDDTFGGGIWEDNKPKDSKNALSNNPMIVAGCALYQITHDATYLTRCKEIYTWVHDHIFDAATGQVNEGIAHKGILTSDNVYNSGAFINAANALHNLTGAANYYDDALLAADHVVKKHPILHHNNRGDNCWSDQFARGLSYFCRDNKLWDRYHSWIAANAKSAWSFRRTDLNVTWNNWKTPTPMDECSSLECLGAVVIQQVILPAP